LFTAPIDPATTSRKIVDSTTIALNSVDVHIGSRMHIRRMSRGVSEQELSQLLGIDRSNLAAFEAGAQRINANLLLRVSKVLGVRPDYFFRGYLG
jgi:transcriptional regulator with XRE-family HTH domain